MDLRLIRNATMRLRYAGLDLLTDPYLAARHSLPSYAGKSLNPLVDLPCTPEEVVSGMDVTIISHLHGDHFDAAGQALLPKDTFILCQPGDETRIRAKGFTRVAPVADTWQRDGVTITRVPAQHGTGHVLGEMGVASGFILQAAGEPTIYWAGDSVWCDVIAENITRFSPDVIITHSCGATWDEGVLIVMDAAQTIETLRAAPQAIVVAIHMEAVDHGTISRGDLRHAASDAGISPDQLLIPEDGATITLAAR